MCLCFAFQFIDLVLVKDEEFLDSKGKGFDDLTCARRFVRAHEFTELSQVEEVAASLSEFLAELLKGLWVATHISNDQIGIRIERKSCLVKLKDLLRWNSLQD